MKVYSYFLESISISIGNVALFDTFRFPYTLCYPRFCPGRSAFLTDRVVLFALDRAIQLSSLPLFISNRYLLISKMVASQRMKVANEKASKYVTMRGNVPKSSVSQNLLFFFLMHHRVHFSHSIEIAFHSKVHWPQYLHDFNCPVEWW